MTGNNKVWRAPLAGLAAVAMLATMGVAAGTANAADDYTVTFDGAATDTFVKVDNGESLVDALQGYANLPTAKTVAGQAFVGWYDGDSPVDFTAVVSGSKTVKAKYVSADVTVTFNDAGKIQFAGNAPTSVAYGQGLDAAQLPTDLAGDGTVVVDWKVKTTVDGASTTQRHVATADLTKAFTEGRPEAAAVEISADTIKDGDDVVTVTFAGSTDYKALNWASDGAADADGTLTVDVLKGGDVTAPAFYEANAAAAKKPAAWVDKTTDADVVVAPGASESFDEDTNLQPGQFTDIFTVTFNSDGGSAVDAVRVAKGSTVAEPAAPSKSGYTFKGWTLKGKAFDFANTAITDDITLKAEWYLGSQLKVTFKDSDSNPTPNKTVELLVNGNDYLTADQVPDFTREGYLFAGWDNTATATTVESYKESDLTSTLADNLKSDGSGHDVTFVATWTKATTDIAGAALKYIEINDANAKLFTDASWSEYKTVYEQAQKDYNKAQYESLEVSAATSAQIVKNLNDAWQKLVFKATDDSIKPAYRFYNWKTNEHLFTTNDVEVSILKDNADWNYEGVGFNIPEGEALKSLASFDAATTGSASDVKTQLKAVAQPIAVEVARLYNRITNEHLFTTSAAERDTLIAGDWEYESSFYAPVFSSNKSVYRLYNPILNQHLFTQNQAEVDKTTTEDWVLEGIEFKAL